MKGGEGTGSENAMVKKVTVYIVAFRALFDVVVPREEYEEQFCLLHC